MHAGLRAHGSGNGRVARPDRDADAEYGVGDVVQFPTPDGQGAYAGVVREVNVTDSNAVEYGQVLYRLDPTG